MNENDNSAVYDVLSAAVVDAEDEVAVMAAQRDKHRERMEHYQLAHGLAVEKLNQLTRALESYDG